VNLTERRTFFTSIQVEVICEDFYFTWTEIENI